MAHGFAIICWACHMLFFFFRLVLLSHLLFRVNVGLWAVGFLCYFFFFSSDFSLNFFFLGFIFCLKVEQIIFLFFI